MDYTDNFPGSSLSSHWANQVVDPANDNGGNPPSVSGGKIFLDNNNMNSFGTTQMVMWYDLALNTNKQAAYLSIQEDFMAQDNTIGPILGGNGVTNGYFLKPTTDGKLRIMKLAGWSSITEVAVSEATYDWTTTKGGGFEKDADGSMRGYVAGVLAVSGSDVTFSGKNVGVFLKRRQGGDFQVYGSAWEGKDN